METNKKIQKRQLSQLAEKGNSEILKNKNLQIQSEIISKEIYHYRTLLTNYSSNSKDKSSFFSKIKEEIIQHNNHLRELNQKIKEEIKNSKEKMIKLKNDYDNINDPLIENLDKLKEDNFILDNTTKEKDCLINQLKKDIESSNKYVLFQEPKREIYLKDQKLGEIFIDDILIEIQKLLLLRLKRFNKWNNKVLQKRKEKVKLKKEILNIKNKTYLNSANEKKGRLNILSTTTLKSISPKKNQKKKGIIPSFAKKDEILIYSSSSVSENDCIIDEELHSDEDVNFESKVQNKKGLFTYYLQNIKSNIPSLNLKQIEYNKQKFHKEVDLYSMERRNKNESLSCLIREKLEKKKKIKKKMKKNKLKLEKIENYIAKYKQHFQMVRHLSTNSSFAVTPTQVNQMLEEDSMENYLNVMTTHTTKEPDNIFNNKRGSTKKRFSTFKEQDICIKELKSA